MRSSPSITPTLSFTPDPILTEDEAEDYYHHYYRSQQQLQQQLQQLQHGQQGLSGWMDRLSLRSDHHHDNHHQVGGVDSFSTPQYRWKAMISYCWDDVEQVGVRFHGALVFVKVHRMHRWFASRMNAQASSANLLVWKEAVLRT
jgi:hypothetical protein